MSNKKLKLSTIKDDKFTIVPIEPISLDLSSLEKSFIQNEEEAEKNYNPFKIKEIQTYNPIHKIIFKNQPTEIINTYVPDTKYQFLDENTVIDKNNNRINIPVFIKYSPILNACKYTVSYYDFNTQNLLHLPKLDQNIFPKQDSIYNFSYVDGFFCYLCSKLLNNHNCKNMIDYYGSYLCIQEKFKINISDDFSYLSSYSEFFKNNNKYFTFSYSSSLLNTYGTNKNKSPLEFEDNDMDNEIELEFDKIDQTVRSNNKICIQEYSNKDTQDENLLDINDLIENKGEELLINEKNNNNISENNDILSDTDSSQDMESDSEENTDYTSDNSDNDSETKSTNTEKTEYTTDNSDIDSEDNNDKLLSSDSSSSVDSDEMQIYAYIDNFPVQMICLEKCKNTVDSLFMEDKISEELGLSFMMQITFTLLILQKVFHFTHNDLHTNNIMYVETELEFIYYKYNSVIYKIPTYGYIFKIIDFGRAIYKYNGTVYCSDSYSKGEDAHTLYNFKPFFNKNMPILEPNYSFDLCRLGISIYDTLMEPDIDIKNLDKFQEWIYRLCLDDSNKSIIYKKNGDPRYSGFKMYKMIARTVHNHTPVAQLETPVVKSFIERNDIDLNNAQLIDIDKIPIYI